MVDVCVIGGGAAGMSAALGAFNQGAKKVVLIERNHELGGILNQCIHNGFGIHHFNEELTGPSYAEKMKRLIEKTSIEVKLNTTVTKVSSNKEIHYMNEKEGYQIINPKTIIVAIGCRERTRHQIQIPGKRLAGIMTAGLAQRYLNIDGYLVGKRVFILGSGDIGLIMARRMTLEGAKVIGVAEILPYSNGLNRNLVQCLHDFNIPLYLSHTVLKVEGDKRLEKILVGKVDHQFNVIEGSQKEFNVDTLLLSVGLIPDIELLKESGIKLNPITKSAYVNEKYETNTNGIYVCGNALHVHDLVDYVSEESYQAGKNAAEFTLNKSMHGDIEVKPLNNIRYIIPNKLTKNIDGQIEFKFRVSKPIEKGEIVIKMGDQMIKKINKNFLMPANMEKIKLDSQLIKFFDHKLITVELLEGDNGE